MTPWLLIIGQRALQPPYLEVDLLRSGDEIRGVTAQVRGSLIEGRLILCDSCSRGCVGGRVGGVGEEGRGWCGLFWVQQRG